jgi:hypothetical protein
VTAQTAVIENEVNVVMLVADRDAFLPRLEAETRTEFQKEFLQVIKQRRFEFAFPKSWALIKNQLIQHLRVP